MQGSGTGPYVCVCAHSLWGQCVCGPLVDHMYWSTTARGRFCCLPFPPETALHTNKCSMLFSPLVCVHLIHVLTAWSTTARGRLRCLPFPPKNYYYYLFIIYPNIAHLIQTVAIPGSSLFLGGKAEIDTKHTPTFT